MAIWMTFGKKDGGEERMAPSEGRKLGAQLFFNIEIGVCVIWGDFGIFSDRFQWIQRGL